MVKKYYLLLIVLLHLMQMICLGQNNNKKVEIKAKLSVDTCWLDNDSFIITAEITNRRWYPITIYTNGCFSENVVYDEARNGELFILVSHNGVKYRYYDAVILNKHELPKKHWLWYGSILCNGVFYMGHFQKEQKSKTNEDFGTYTIKAALVTQYNDTIYSNQVVLQYLE